MNNKSFLNNNKLKQGNKFQYLGDIITEDGRCKHEVSERIRNDKNNLSENKTVAILQTNLHSVKKEIYQNIHMVHAPVCM